MAFPVKPSNPFTPKPAPAPAPKPAPTPTHSPGGFSSTPEGAAGGRGHGGRGSGSQATAAENVAGARVEVPVVVTPPQNIPRGVTTQQLRTQESRNIAIANIRAGNVPGVSIRGNIIVNEAGQRVGVRGSDSGEAIIYGTKTGEVISMPSATSESSAKVSNGTAGLYKDGQIYINKEKFNFGTLAHEAGHSQYNRLLQNLPQETKDKIAKEGQIGLQFKYFDFSKNPMGYSTDTFAIEAMGIAGEKLYFGSEMGKQYMATAMPETYKVITASIADKNKPTNIFVSNAEMINLRGTSEVSSGGTTTDVSKGGAYYANLFNVGVEQGATLRSEALKTKLNTTNISNINAPRVYRFEEELDKSKAVLPSELKSLAYVSTGIEYIGAKTTEKLSLIPYFANKETKDISLPYQTRGTSFYTSEKTFVAPTSYSYQAPSKAEFAGEAVKIAPYFIPYVGEGLIIAGGAETIFRMDTSLGQKALGVLAVGGGIWGLKTRVGLAEEAYATKVPRVQKVKIEVITDTSKTIKNVPKINILEDANIQIPRQVKAGTISETKPINPRVITKITSTSDKTFRLFEVSDEAGNVIGTMQKGGGRGIFGQVRDLYKTTYKLNPKTQEVTYNLFKNDKFLNTITQKAISQYGFTEKMLVSQAKVSSTKVLKTQEEIVPGIFELKPTNIKQRVISKRKTYEQSLVNLQNKKEEISGEFISKENVKRITTLSPAKQNINLYQKIYEPSKDIKMVVTTKQATGKFAKSSPPDIEKVKLKIARDNERLVGTFESRTPRFEDVVVQSFSGEGEFTIINQNALQKYGSKFLSNKKAQLQLIAPKTIEQEQLIIQTQVKVPAFKTSELDTQFKIFIPEMAKVSKASINIGLFGFANLKSLEQARAVEQIKALSNAKANVFEQARPQLLEQNKAKTFVQDRAISLAQEQPQPQEQSVIKVQKPQTQFKSNRPTEPKITEEIIKIPIPPITQGDFMLSLLKARKKKRAIFEALSRRKGKEFSLGTYETQARAESVLGKYLKSTLAASGRIRAEGKVLPFTSLGLKSREFRAGKSDIFKVVQRRGFRLGTRGERVEIKRAKRSKLKVW